MERDRARARRKDGWEEREEMGGKRRRYSSVISSIFASAGELFEEYNLEAEEEIVDADRRDVEPWDTGVNTCNRPAPAGAPACIRKPREAVGFMRLAQVCLAHMRVAERMNIVGRVGVLLAGQEICTDCLCRALLMGLCKAWLMLGNLRYTVYLHIPRYPWCFGTMTRGSASHAGPGFFMGYS